jgi:hypothetical protein
MAQFKWCKNKSCNPIECKDNHACTDQMCAKTSRHVAHSSETLWQYVQVDQKIFTPLNKKLFIFVQKLKHLTNPVILGSCKHDRNHAFNYSYNGDNFCVVPFTNGVNYDFDFFMEMDGVACINSKYAVQEVGRRNAQTFDDKKEKDDLLREIELLKSSVKAINSKTDVSIQVASAALAHSTSVGLALETSLPKEMSSNFSAGLRRNFQAELANIQLECEKETTRRIEESRKITEQSQSVMDEADEFIKRLLGTSQPMIEPASSSASPQLMIETAPDAPASASASP